MEVPRKEPERPDKWSGRSGIEHHGARTRTPIQCATRLAAPSNLTSLPPPLPPAELPWPWTPTSVRRSPLVYLTTPSPCTDRVNNSVGNMYGLKPDERRRPNYL